MKLFDIVRLLRPLQWYKNLLVVLPLIFSRNLLNPEAVFTTLIAFASLCAISSSSYILNDIADRSKDRLNPEKASRPLASGRVGIVTAVFLVLLLCFVGFGLAILLPSKFLFTVLALFALSQLYTIWLKHEVFADIIAVSVNFVLRSVSGAFVIDVVLSPWLIAGVFFLALFLIVGKRKSELSLLKENAFSHRKVLKEYTPEIISKLGVLSTAALVLSYSLYVFFGHFHLLFITLPVALYAIFRYDSLISGGSVVARHPERVFTDVRMCFAMILWGALTIGVLYF